jgi:hypothetical protein
MLSVIYAQWHLCVSFMLSVIYAECHYAECHLCSVIYAECPLCSFKLIIVYAQGHLGGSCRVPFMQSVV